MRNRAAVTVRNNCTKSVKSSRFSTFLWLLCTRKSNFKEVYRITPYREIFRLKTLGLSVSGIARSVSCARNTVARVLSLGEQLNISWPIEASDIELPKMLFPGDPEVHPERKMPDFDYVHRELRKKGVTRKLLWNEYVNECKIAGVRPYLYTQFCHYIILDEQKRNAIVKPIKYL